MSAPRRAALVLHALDTRDREWLLARLAPAQRTTLQGLLGELEELGVVRDPSLVRELVGHGSVQAGHDPLPEIAAASQQAVAAVLGDEPAGMIELVLAVHEWPWREALLDGLGRAKREQVESLAAARISSRKPVARGLRDALMDELAQRLHRAEANAPAVRRRSIWRGLPRLRGTA
jgi:hypothetical protein